MTAFHVAVTCCEDYLERRRPGRDLHHAQLQAWRAQGLLVGGGPAPDGRTVDLFWQAEDADTVAQLMREDQFIANGLWAAFVGRRFADFFGTLETPPLDGSRLAVILEGRAADPALAATSLLALRDDGRVAFGGLFPEGDSLALALTADTREALRWLAAAEGWIADGLAARAFYYVL